MKLDQFFKDEQDSDERHEAQFYVSVTTRLHC